MLKACEARGEGGTSLWIFKGGNDLGGGGAAKFSLYILYIVNINIYDENIKNIYFLVLMAARPG